MGTFPNTDTRRKPSQAGLTRAGLAQVIAADTQLSTVQCRNIVNALFDEMIRCLEAGKRIEIRGFGTLKVSPRKGDRYSLKAKFITSKDLLQIINAKA